MTVDHVTPTTLGGSDDPSNLVAACASCNGGKSATNPAAAVVADVAEDALRWQRAIKAVADQRSADRDAAAETARRFRDNWMFQYERHHHVKCDDHAPDWCAFELPSNFAGTIGELLGAGLTTDDLIEAIRQTWGQDFRIRSLWRYFCGVAWNMVTAQHEAARALLDNAPEEEGDVPAVLRLPRRELMRMVLNNLMEDTEAVAVMAVIGQVEDGWQKRVLRGLENGYHRERARREALDSSRYEIDCAVDRIFREADNRAEVAKFKAVMKARAAAK